MLNPKFKLDPQFVKSRNKQLWLTLWVYCFLICALAGLGSAIGDALFTALRLGSSGKVAGGVIGTAIAIACILWREDLEAKKRAETRALNRQIKESLLLNEERQDSGEDPFPVSIPTADKSENANSFSRYLYPALGGLLVLLVALAWFLATQRSSQPRTIQTGRTIFALAFSPDGKILATAGHDSVRRPEENGTYRIEGIAEITLWDASTLRPLRTIKPPCEAALDVAFSPDGKQLASCCDDFHPGGNLWEVQTGKLVRHDSAYPAFKSLPWAHANASSHGYRPPALSPDGKLKYVLNGDKIKLFDTRTKELVKTLEAGSGAVAFSPDSSTVATVDRQGTVQLRRIK